MAVGTVTSMKTTRTIKLLEGVTATNGKPIGLGSAVGVAMQDLFSGVRSADAVLGALWIASTAGSGTMTAQLRLWLALAASGYLWFPAGTNITAASRGVINEAGSLDEVDSDKIRHVEPVAMPGLADMVYLEVVSIGGTATALDAYLSIPQGS